MKKQEKLALLGWIFLILGTISVVSHVFFGRWQYAVWFCNHAMLIAGIAVLLRNRFWLTAMLNWALIPVSIWIIDFVSKLFFDTYLFKITEYMFLDPWWKHLLSLQHLLTIPLMLYALWLIGKPHKRAFIGTATHGAILWLISYFIITSDYNINCVHNSCSGIIPNTEFYIFIWPILAIIMFVITNLFLVWLFKKRGLKAKRR